MGALADAVLDHGGTVTGVIPEFLGQPRSSMLVRAQKRSSPATCTSASSCMFERADAFVALPGGIGTLEELVEQLTWAQLGRHKQADPYSQHPALLGPALRALEHMKELLSFARPIRSIYSWRSTLRDSAEIERSSPQHLRRRRRSPRLCSRAGM